MGRILEKNVGEISCPKQANVKTVSIGKSPSSNLCFDMDITLIGIIISIGAGIIVIGKAIIAFFKNPRVGKYIRKIRRRSIFQIVSGIICCLLRRHQFEDIEYRGDQYSFTAIASGRFPKSVRDVE